MKVVELNELCKSYFNDMVNKYGNQVDIWKSTEKNSFCLHIHKEGFNLTSYGTGVTSVSYDNYNDIDSIGVQINKDIDKIYAEIKEQKIF